MYSYLNKKYGLKSLIVEQAAAILKSVYKFSVIDNDVAVFLNIYNNIMYTKIFVMFKFDSRKQFRSFYVYI
eukprot:GSMAST32.ASY1.ANO1.1446.1 assembled CDS